MTIDDLKLIDSEWELFRALDRMTVEGWYPHQPPLAIMRIGCGWQVCPHGTGRYHYIDGTKRGDTERFRVNVTNELVSRMEAQCTRRSASA